MRRIAIIIGSTRPVRNGKVVAKWVYRLLVKVERGYEGLGLALLDLVSESNIGLTKGVERFQPTNHRMGGRILPLDFIKH